MSAFPPQQGGHTNGNGNGHSNGNGNGDSHRPGPDFGHRPGNGPDASAARGGGSGVEPASVAAHLRAIRNDPMLARLVEQFVPVSAMRALGPADALETVLQADRLVLVGAPGSGKTSLLRAALYRLAGSDQGAGWVPVYVDLALAHSGEGVEDLVARQLAGVKLDELTPAMLLLDNLDRATDVYLLEGLELLLRAGGKVGPAVVLACREADWPVYQSWCEGVPTAQLQPLSGQAVMEALHRYLPAGTATAAERWLARDRQLAGAVRAPLGLHAFLAALRDRSADRWRRTFVLDALLDAVLNGVPSAERRAYRAALGDIALSNLGSPLLQVDTLVMGLGASRDDLIRTGAVVARGAALAFVEPLLGQHCAALALAAHAADPRQLAERLGDLDDQRRAETLVHVYSLAPDPVGFVAALLALPGGPELAARCLGEPDAADPVGPTGSGTVVGAICNLEPPPSVAILFRLGEALARAGQTAASEVALQAALKRTGDGVELDEVFERPDIDLPPPVQAWVRRYLAERNRALALRSLSDVASSGAAFGHAEGALELLGADLTFEQGLLAAERGDLEAACKAFEAALAVEPERVRYLFHYGKTLLAVGRTEPAVRYLQQARDGAPHQAEIEAALGDAFRAQDWIDEALASYQTASRLAPYEAWYEQMAGEICAELGDLEAAATAMGHAVALRPNVAEWHDGFGQVLGELGRWDNAAREFQDAAGLDARNPIYLRHLAQAQQHLGAGAAAIETLRQAISVAPEEAGLHADLGRALAIAGNSAGAIDSLRRAIAIDPDWPVDHLRLAELLRESAVHDEALAHARRAVDLAPASAMALAELGRVHDARGEYREALAAYNHAVEHDPLDPSYRRHQALARRELGDAAGALTGLATMAQLAPKSVTTLDGLAKLYQDGGQLEEALDVLSQAAALAPDQTVYHRRAGKLALALGRTDEAVVHLARAAALAGSDAEVHRELGRALAELGDHERALGILRRAARLAPEQVDVWADLAAAAHALGRQNEAREAIDKALLHEDSRADLFALKGEMEIKAGDLAAATLALRRAVALAPDERRYRLQLADLSRSTDAGGARALLESMAADAPDQEVHLRLAVLHAAAGAWGRAVEEYAKARAYAPDNPQLAAAHGAALRQAGRNEEAIQLLEGLLDESADARIMADGRTTTDGKTTTDGRTMTDGRRMTDARTAADAGTLVDAGTLADAKSVANTKTAADATAVVAQLAQAYEAAGRDQDALKMFSRAAAAEALEPPGLLRWSQLARRAGELETAINAARQAVTALPDWAEAYAGLAEAYAAAGLAEAALAAVRRAAELSPEEPVWRERQARLARELGRFEEAIAALEEGISDCPAAPTLHYELGQAFAAHGWAEEARAAFGRASELAPENTLYARALAVHQAADEPTQALDTLRRAVAAAPEDAEAAFQLGLLHRQRGDLDNALTQFQRAARMAPQEPDYLRAQGECLLQLGRLAEAAGTLKASLQLAPHDPATHATLADLYTQEGRFPAALDAYATAARLAPTVSGYWRLLGTLRLAREDYAGAVEALSQAVQLDPADHESHGALARALEHAGEKTQAVLAYRESAQRATNDAAGDLAQARAQLAAGQPAGAIPLLERALALQSNHRDALRLLVQATCATGDNDSALHYAERLTSLDPDNAESWLALAAAQRARRDLNAAATALDRAAALEPGTATTFIARAEVAEEAGDPAAACAAYGRAVALAPDLRTAAVRFAELVSGAGWQLIPVLPETMPAVAPDHAQAAEAALEQVLAAGGTLAVRGACALALIRGCAGDPGGAVDAAGQAVRLAEALPGDPMTATHPLLILAWSQLVAGDSAAALHAVGQARAMGLDSVEIHLLAGRAHEAQAEFALASAAYRQAVVRAPELAPAQAALDRVNLRLGRPAITTGSQRAGAARTTDFSVKDNRSTAEDRHGADDYPSVDTPSPMTADDHLIDENSSPATADDHQIDETPSLTNADDHLIDRTSSPTTADDYLFDRTPSSTTPDDHLINRTPSSTAAGDTDTTVQRRLGAEAKAAGDRVAAIGHYETAARLGDHSAATFVALGELYAEDGALDEAIQAFQQAAVCAPHGAEPHLRLGSVCRQAGLLEKALVHYTRAAELAAADPEPLHMLGQLHLAGGDPDRALLAYEGAIARDPNGLVLYMEAGALCRQLRRYGRAAELFRAATRLAPTHTAAYRQLAAVTALQIVDRSSRDEMDA